MLPLCTVVKVIVRTRAGRYFGWSWWKSKQSLASAPGTRFVQTLQTSVDRAFVSFLSIPHGSLDGNRGDPNLSIEVNRRIRNAGCSFRKYTLELYDRPSAPLEHKFRMLRAEVLETMLYGCVTWSLRTCHYDHSFLTRCTGWGKNNRADHSISYLDTLVKAGSGSIEETLRRRWIFFAGCVARMEDTRLPKCVMFGELMGGAGCVGGQGKEWVGCSLDDLRAFGINAAQWTTAAQDEGGWRRTAEQGAERFMVKWSSAVLVSIIVSDLSLLFDDVLVCLPFC